MSRTSLSSFCIWYSLMLKRPTFVLLCNHNIVFLRSCSCNRHTFSLSRMFPYFSSFLSWVVKTKTRPLRARSRVLLDLGVEVDDVKAARYWDRSQLDPVSLSYSWSGSLILAWVVLGTRPNLAIRRRSTRPHRMTLWWLHLSPQEPRGRAVDGLEAFSLLRIMILDLLGSSRRHHHRDDLERFLVRSL